MINSPGFASRGPWEVNIPGSANVQVVDSAGNLIAPVTANSVNVPTGKTATVVDADALSVGGKIVPQTFFINISQAQFGLGTVVLPVACKAVSVRERHKTAESTAATLTGMLKKVPSGTALSAGTDMLAAGVNLKGTADTNASPALHATAGNYTLAAGDGIGILASTTITELAGSEFTVELQRV